ncbi:hypothetical protein SAMN05444851_2011 [Aliiroseovarius sediminilitoris]|uniref:Uncharacterized protein n=1 Tax=Aliiroseovarius sediminilitoris TaxID=1173584 RepID=A0A1I0PX52_9RHOB|nr:hypothetical protein [Aliiroseovarius sediminilitoris]SEW19169.1 hypothetical protein SAMN05444851_2011 [Aliiroseovarius sediminilitoris]
MEIVSTGDGRYAAIGPLRDEAAFCMVTLNGRMVCVTTSELYREAVDTLLRNPPEVGTPYLMTYSGAEFVALFDKALTERLDGADPADAAAVVSRALAVLTGLRNDEANRDFWPEVDALLAKLEVR